MLIPGRVLQMLTDAGVTVVAQQHGGGDRAVDLTVTVSGRDTPLLLEVKAFDRPVTPKLLDRLSGRLQGPGRRGLLVIGPSASSRVRELAVDQGISLIALNSDLISGPDGHLAFAPGDVVTLGPDRGVPGTPSPQRRRSWGTSSVLRALLLRGGRTQRDIAELAGVSQPWVSRVIADLSADRLVEPAHPAGSGPPSSGGWLVRDWLGLLHRWWGCTQGPAGSRRSGTGLTDPGGKLPRSLRPYVRDSGPRPRSDTPRLRAAEPRWYPGTWRRTFWPLGRARNARSSTPALGRNSPTSG